MSGRMEQMYRRFLDTVVQGRQSRGVTVARADELGRGRVWTGSQAAVVGLVDRMGGISAAIDEAARRGGVTLGPGGLPELVVLPRPVPSLLARCRAFQAVARRCACWRRWSFREAPASWRACPTTSKPSECRLVDAISGANLSG